MTNEERVEEVQQLGYTRRQAAFLCLAALHGGYFVRRQCNSFLGLEPGGTAERLIAKGIEKGHIRVHPSANKTLIYHVGHRSFFQAIGQKDNRNRRWRQPYSVKVKLMGLDYVLAHPENIYLTTEEEKTGYFCGQLGLGPELLPARTYGSRSNNITATRYFVDKFPVFLSGAPSAPSSLVGFCYIDASARQPSGFDTYIKHHLELWRRIPKTEVIYVSADRRMFAQAKRLFERMIASPVSSSGHLGDKHRDRLLEHFQRRELLEKRQTFCFDQCALDRLRAELEEFSGIEYAALYARWKVEGAQAVVPRCANGSDSGIVCFFSTFELWHDYKLFENVVRNAG